MPQHGKAVAYSVFIWRAGQGAVSPFEPPKGTITNGYLDFLWRSLWLASLDTVSNSPPSMSAWRKASEVPQSRTMTPRSKSWVLRKVSTLCACNTHHVARSSPIRKKSALNGMGTVCQGRTMCALGNKSNLANKSSNMLFIQAFGRFHTQCIAGSP